MSGKSKIILLIIVIIVAIFAYRHYNQPAPEPQEITQTKVGVLAPLTGVMAPWGEESERGINEAVVENSEFIFEDTQCEPTEAVNAFKKLSEVDQLKFYIGPSCGSPQEAIAPMIKDKDMVVLLPVAASEKLHEQSGGKVFQMQYSIEAESKYIAQQMNAQGFERVAAINYQNAFSQTSFNAFKSEFDGVIDEITFVDMTTDLNTGITKIKRFEPEAIYVSDVSFFVVNGLEKLATNKIEAPIYSLYVTQYEPIRSLVEGVIYSFPGNLDGDQGPEYSLNKAAAELMGKLLSECNSQTDCVLNKLNNSPDFNDQGISTRPLILKQVVNGQPVKFSP